MDQTAGMLDEDVQEKGYALLCVAQPQSDCMVQTIEEVRVQQQHLCHELRCSSQRCSTQLAADVSSANKGSWVACYSWCHPWAWLACVCTVYLHGMFTICLHAVEHICITLPAANTLHAHLVNLSCQHVSRRSCHSHL